MEVGGTLLASKQPCFFAPPAKMCLASQLKRRRTGGLSMEKNYLLPIAPQSTAHSSKHTDKTLEVV
jgi:hypothetical protein